MKSLFFFLTLLLCFTTGAQNAREVLKKMQAFYSAETFEVYSSYELFKGHKSTQVEASYTGYYQKSKAGCYQKIDQAESISTADYFLAINHGEQLMQLEKSKDLALNNLDLEGSLKYCSSLKLKEDEDHYIVLVYFPGNSELPLSLLKITIGKKNYELKALDLYYAEPMDFSAGILTQDFDQAHLRITYRDFSTKVKSDEKRYRLSTYVATRQNELVPEGSCKHYELVDKRLKK